MAEIRVSESIHVACWQHSNGVDNPADCSSREMFPAELVEHDAWRKGRDWLKEDEDNWNKRVSLDEHPIPTEERATFRRYYYR